MPRYSIVTTEGFERSYVPLSIALKRLKYGGSGDASTESSKQPPVFIDYSDYRGSDSAIQGSGLYKGAVFSSYDFPDLESLDVDELNGMTLFDGTNIVTLSAVTGDGYAIVTVTSASSPNTDDIYYIKDYDTYYHFVEADGGFVPSVLCVGYRKSEIDVTSYVTIRFKQIITMYRWCVYLNPAIYADFVNNSGETLTDLTIINDCCNEYPFMDCCQFIGRFTAPVDDFTINLDASLSASDKNPTIVGGHTYEYNIMDGIFNLTDVTAVSPSTEAIELPSESKFEI